MKKRKSREKREMLGQFTIRFYKGSPADELIFETLDPLPQGTLRITLVEALRLGILGLKKQGWPLLNLTMDTSAPVEKKVAMVPVQTVPATTPQTTPVDKEPVNQVNQARTALQELMGE